MKNLFIALTLSTGLMSSCIHKYFSNAGKTTTEYRNVSYYNSIYAEGAIDIFITHDSSYNIKVEAGEHLLDYIETDVVNEQLIIRRTESNIINTKPIRVYLNVDSLIAIELYGSGNFNSEELNCSSLDISTEGSGNIDLQLNANTLNLTSTGSGNKSIRGNVFQHNYYEKGSGNLNARHLYTNNSDITIEGSGNATIYVTDYLNAHIDGSGNIFYYGHPTNVDYQIDGSGNIFEKN